MLTYCKLNICSLKLIKPFMLWLQDINSWHTNRLSLHYVKPSLPFSYLRLSSWMKMNLHGATPFKSGNHMLMAGLRAKAKMWMKSKRKKHLDFLVWNDEGLIQCTAAEHPCDYIIILLLLLYSRISRWKRTPCLRRRIESKTVQ